MSLILLSILNSSHFYTSKLRFYQFFRTFESTYDVAFEVLESPQCISHVNSFQVIARLLAFMLFTLFWGPGNFYPLMIFIVIHMLIAALLHVVFSEDLAFLKKGHYLKFFHNVIMNAFASIYFHNYLRFDEMPSSNKKDPEFIGKFNF